LAPKLKELKEREGNAHESAEVKVAYEAMRAAKAAAEEQHQGVTVLAMAAQGEHDSMVKLFNEADVLRRQADGAQGEFVKSKVEADKVHRDYLDAVNAVRDVERVAYIVRAGGRVREERGPQESHVDPSGQAQARRTSSSTSSGKGEKLSTEDLMALQKAGRL